MKLTNTITECVLYAIINHEDSDCRVTKAALQCPSLNCSFSASNEWEDIICEVSDEALRRDFLAACNGDSLRWRLLRVQIARGFLTFWFADLCATGSERFEQYFVSCDKPVDCITLTAERPETGETDLYYMEYFGKEGVDFRNTGEFEVAEIMEQREGKPLQLEHIVRRGDKYYLDSYFVD